MFHAVFAGVRDRLSSWPEDASLSASSASIALVISLLPGRTRLGQAPFRLPSLPIRYLWKFHLGAAASPASPEIHW